MVGVEDVYMESSAIWILYQTAAEGNVPRVRIISDLEGQVGDILPESVAFRSREVELRGESCFRLLEAAEGVSYGVFKSTVALRIEMGRTGTARDVERMRTIPRRVLERQGAPLQARCRTGVDACGKQPQSHKKWTQHGGRGPRGTMRLDFTGAWLLNWVEAAITGNLQPTSHSSETPESVAARGCSSTALGRVGTVMSVCPAVAGHQTLDYALTELPGS